jgi:hypothetical protein
MALCVLVFGRGIIRAGEPSWRAAVFLVAVMGLCVFALSASSVAVAALPAIYPLVFDTLPLAAALVVTMVVNITPLIFALLFPGPSWPNLPLAVAVTLIGVIAAPVIGTVIITSIRQRENSPRSSRSSRRPGPRALDFRGRPVPRRSGKGWHGRSTTLWHKDLPASSRWHRPSNRNWTATPRRPRGTSS